MVLVMLYKLQLSTGGGVGGGRGVDRDDGGQGQEEAVGG